MNNFMPMEISAMGLEAQRIRLATIASNLANIYSTRSADGSGPYRRRDVVFRATVPAEFQKLLEGEIAGASERFGLANEALLAAHLRGVQVIDVIPDTSPLRWRYEPKHPDANEEGYVAYPNISLMEEMTNIISASRSYDANLATLKITKDMMLQALDILRR